MYRNLEAEIVRKGLLRKEVAAHLGCSASTLSLKKKEKTPRGGGGKPICRYFASTRS